MVRIAEKLGFIKVQAIMVCAKVGIARKVGHKKPCFPTNFNKNASKKKLLDSSR